MTKREKKLQDQCVKYLEKHDIYYVNVYGSGRSGKGAPDLLICLNGRFVGCELKVGTNDLQDDQKIHAIRIKRSGGIHIVPRTFEEFKKTVKELQSLF